MDPNTYGPFAATLAIAAALIATFSVLLAKSVGSAAKWSWLVGDTPAFMVTVPARVASVGVIAAVFLLISRQNYLFFLGGALVLGLVAMVLVLWFDRLRRKHSHPIPLVGADGNQLVDKKGNLEFRTVIIGTEKNMQPGAKKLLAKARQEHGPVSLRDFISGAGGAQLNNPEAFWDRSLLASIGSKMTSIIVLVFLLAVVALYTSAASVEVNQRPVSSEQLSAA